MSVKRCVFVARSRDLYTWWRPDFWKSGERVLGSPANVQSKLYHTYHIHRSVFVGGARTFLVEPDILFASSNCFTSLVGMFLMSSSSIQDETLG